MTLNVVKRVNDVLGFIIILKCFERYIKANINISELDFKCIKDLVVCLNFNYKVVTEFRSMPLTSKVSKTEELLFYILKRCKNIILLLNSLLYRYW